MFLFRQYYLGKKFCYSVTLLMIIYISRNRCPDATAKSMAWCSWCSFASNRFFFGAIFFHNLKKKKLVKSQPYTVTANVVPSYASQKFQLHGMVPGEWFYQLYNSPETLAETSKSDTTVRLPAFFTGILPNKRAHMQSVS